MFKDQIIAVCSQIHTKHINTLCGQPIKGGRSELGLGEMLTTGVTKHFTRSRVLPTRCVRFSRHAQNTVCLNYKDSLWPDITYKVSVIFVCVQMKSGSVDSFGQNFNDETSRQSVHWLSLWSTRRDGRKNIKDEANSRVCNCFASTANKLRSIRRFLRYFTYIAH